MPFLGKIIITLDDYHWGSIFPHEIYDSSKDRDYSINTRQAEIELLAIYKYTIGEYIRNPIAGSIFFNALVSISSDELFEI